MSESALRDQDVPDDPLAWFATWYEEARRLDVREPSAVTLATADARGRPSARVVLLKGWDERGFVIYTNWTSRKGHELEANPHAALCFYWDEHGRQVRVRGRVERVADEEADAYWQTRPRDSQIGAWASHQSAPLSSREALLERVAELHQRYADREVPRPPHWTGARIVPEEIELWQRGPHRLHDRFLFVREGAGWTRQRLYP